MHPHVVAVDLALIAVPMPSNMAVHATWYSTWYIARHLLFIQVVSKHRYAAQTHVCNADQQVSWDGSHAALPNTNSMGASPLSSNSYASFR